MATHSTPQKRNQSESIHVRFGSSVRKNGGLGDTNVEDSYRIRLNSRSHLSISLKNRGGNADLYVQTRQKDVIQSSTRRGNRAELINATLDAGTYFIQVQSKSDRQTRYRLKSTFSSLSKGFEPAESLDRTSTIRLDSPNSDRITSLSSNTISLASPVQTSPSSTSSSSFQHPSTTPNTGSEALISEGSTDLDSSSTSSISNFLTHVVNNPLTNLSQNQQQDWFDQHIHDVEIRAIARSKFSDHVLDRRDIIDIFNNSKDGKIVDSTEFQDLKTIVQNANYLDIPDHIRVLANKVVNGDRANQVYKGANLGNLQANSSDRHLANLVDKWFFGGDRPATQYAYRAASGQLFQNGVSYDDVQQGKLNDCYILASLAATAHRTPGTIESMFIDNGDNTFTVRYYNQGVADYVTVDRYLPTDALGRWVYASGKAQSAANSANELWVALAEKAYAQINESGWTGQDGTNSYAGIEIGRTSIALNHVTRKSTGFQSIGSSSRPDALINAFQAGELITLSSKGAGDIASTIVADHAYVLLDYNPATQLFKLFNPWGTNGGYSNGHYLPGTLELAWDKIVQNFDGQTYTTA